MDETSELQCNIHFCGGAEDDGCAAEDGHLAKGVMRMEDSGGWMEVETHQQRHYSLQTPPQV